MSTQIKLASGSEIRSQLLHNSAIPHITIKAAIDEEAVKHAMLDDGAAPRDIADTLAEMKARKVSSLYPNDLVLGADQVLTHKGALYSKPKSPQDLVNQLAIFSGKTHTLLSAAVVYHGGSLKWRHIGQATLTMRVFSRADIEEYVKTNWSEIQHTVGGYMIEKEGLRLFEKISGDYFSILGLPVLEVKTFFEGYKGMDHGA